MQQMSTGIASYGDLLTVEEFAELTHKSVFTVRRCCAAKKLPGVKIGARWYIPKFKIEELFEDFHGAA